MAVMLVRSIVVGLGRRHANRWWGHADIVALGDGCRVLGIGSEVSGPGVWGLWVLGVIAVGKS